MIALLLAVGAFGASAQSDRKAVTLYMHPDGSMQDTAPAPPSTRSAGYYTAAPAEDAGFLDGGARLIVEREGASLLGTGLLGTPTTYVLRLDGRTLASTRVDEGFRSGQHTGTLVLPNAPTPIPKGGILALEVRSGGGLLGTGTPRAPIALSYTFTPTAAPASPAPTPSAPTDTTMNVTGDVPTTPIATTPPTGTGGGSPAPGGSNGGATGTDGSTNANAPAALGSLPIPGEVAGHLALLAAAALTGISIVRLGRY